MLPADRSSVHCPPRPASFMHRGGGGRNIHSATLQQTWRKQRSAERRRRVSWLVKEKAVAQSFGDGSDTNHQICIRLYQILSNLTAGVRCAAAGGTATAGTGCRGAPRPLSRPPRTGRVEEVMVEVDITTINVQSNITTTLPLLMSNPTLPQLEP